MSQYSFTVTNSIGRVYWKEASGAKYLEGCVITPYGIVSMYSQGHDLACDKHTHLDFVLDGRCHSLSIKRAFTAKGCAIVAGRFAKQIAGST